MAFNSPPDNMTTTVMIRPYRIVLCIDRLLKEVGVYLNDWKIG
jgi:hypothetical protein